VISNYAFERPVKQCTSGARASASLILQPSRAPRGAASGRSTGALDDFALTSHN